LFSSADTMFLNRRELVRWDKYCVDARSSTINTFLEYLKCFQNNDLDRNIGVATAVPDNMRVRDLHKVA